MAWLATLDTGEVLQVPTVPRDTSENILRFGLKAILRRLLRSHNYLVFVANGSRVVKFVNTVTNEELTCGNVKHAGFTDLFAAKMEMENRKKVMFHTTKKFFGYSESSEPAPLDFEGSVIASVRAKVNTINATVIQPSRHSFMMVEFFENPINGNPFAIEHHFTFRS
jgi:hypothetical protein